jgi:UPF0755 protein
MKLNKPALLRVIAALAIIFLFTAGTHQLRKGSAAAADFPCGSAASGEVDVSIGQGATGAEIAKQLFELEVVKSSAAFFRLAVSDQRSERIAPGTHKVEVNLCAKEALDQLLDPKRIVDLVSIVEGAWNSEIFEEMLKSGFKRDDIKAAIKATKLPEKFKTLEGLLFPAQYSFAEGTSAQTAIGSMVDRAVSEMSEAGFNSGQGKYSPQQLLVIASIIQAEGEPSNFAQVSRVIHNRLEKGIPLQMDSTVHYVMKSRGNIFLSTKSTLIKSQYNTYRRYGLPPGPIGNPGAAAMQAAVNPAAGNWTYFITVAPGDTRFTTDLDEFNVWKAEYKKNLRAGAFGSSK